MTAPSQCAESQTGLNQGWCRVLSPLRLAPRAISPLNHYGSPGVLHQRPQQTQVGIFQGVPRAVKPAPRHVLAHSSSSSGHSPPTSPYAAPKPFYIGTTTGYPSTPPASGAPPLWPSSPQTVPRFATNSSSASAQLGQTTTTTSKARPPRSVSPQIPPEDWRPLRSKPVALSDASDGQDWRPMRAKTVSEVSDVQSPHSLRLPCWHRHDDAQGPGTCDAAVAVLQELLANRIGPEREDLEYVIRCIEGLRSVAADGGGAKPFGVGAQSKAFRKSIYACDKSDKDTKAFLIQSFGGQVYKPPKLKSVVTALKSCQMLRRFSLGASESPQRAPLSISDVLDLDDAPELRKELINHRDSWMEFNVFRVAELTNGKPLQPVMLSVIVQRNIFQAFRFDLPTLCNFLSDAEAAYNQNPYHSSIHAADTTQGVHVLLTKFPDIHFSDLEILASIFAAAVHDIGHLGVTNEFRVADEDEGALTYNDKSVNENSHCALAYSILRKPQNNWLGVLTNKQAASVRKLVIDIVLGTDMSNHFGNLKNFRDLTEGKGNDMSCWDFDAHPHVLEMIVHSADISNPSRSLEIAKGWADRVLEEFFAQGDREREIGRPLSPLCDRTTVKLPQSQIGFVNFVVMPTYEALGVVIDTALPMENLRNYVKHWERVDSEPTDEFEHEREHCIYESTGSCE